MAKSLSYDFLKCATKMPPLKNGDKNNFDIMESDVCNWLVNQPEIRQKIFDLASRKGIIVYNSINSTWQGVDYDDN